MDKILVQVPTGVYSRVLDLTNVTPSTTVDGSLIKAGTSASTVSCSTTASMKFVSLYTESAAISGDARSIYNRLYISGIGGGGESLRCFTTVSNVAGATAHGAHISLSFAATGSLTGQGIASRNTLHIPDVAMTGGIYSALQAEIWSDGDDSDAAAVTELSFIRVVNGGNANGIADVDDDAYLMSISGGSIASGNMVAVKSSAAVSHTLKIKVGATVMYLMASTTQ